MIKNLLAGAFGLSIGSVLSQEAGPIDRIVLLYGPSTVGKDSFINTICNEKIATPGKDG